MNLFDLTAYIKQVLPPKWRSENWRYQTVYALCRQLFYRNAHIDSLYQSTLTRMNITPEVIIMEAYLRVATTRSESELFLVDSSAHGQFSIYLATAYQSQSGLIRSLLSGRIPIGY
jgi:hypothetical protein